MSDAHSSHVSDAHATAPDEKPHGAAAHAGGGDAHGDDDMHLGPIDWTIWAVGATGVAVAVVMAALFWVAAYS